MIMKLIHLNIEINYFIFSRLNLVITKNYELKYINSAKGIEILDLNHDYIINAKGVNKLNKLSFYNNYDKRSANWRKRFFHMFLVITINNSFVLFF